MQIILNQFLSAATGRWRWAGWLGVLALVAGCAGPRPATPPAGPPSAAVAKPQPKIGLALGGGAARGFAHVGVLQVLEEAGLKPDFVAGTSAGSLVAALHASGRSGAQLQALAMEMDEAAFADWTLPVFNRGMLRGEALARYVNQQVSHKLIEQLPVPLGILATDLATGQGVLFRRGDVGTAVRASSAVPAVFLPVRIGSQEFVDGGLVAPVPVRQVRQMGAEFVIAVDISSAPEGNASNDAIAMLLQTFAIMGRSINQWELREADLVVRPALPGMRGADFSARGRAIAAGRAAMQAALPQLRAALAAKAL